MNNNKNKSNLNRCTTGKFQRKVQSNREYYNDHLRSYRPKKIVKELIDRFSLIRLSEMTGYSASYISHVERGIKPSDDFIEKMEQLNATL